MSSTPGHNVIMMDAMTRSGASHPYFAPSAPHGVNGPSVRSATKQLVRRNIKPLSTRIGRLSSPSMLGKPSGSFMSGKRALDGDAFVSLSSKGSVETQLPSTIDLNIHPLVKRQRGPSAVSPIPSVPSPPPLRRSNADALGPRVESAPTYPLVPESLPDPLTLPPAPKMGLSPTPPPLPPSRSPPPDSPPYRVATPPSSPGSVPITPSDGWLDELSARLDPSLDDADLSIVLDSYFV